VLERHAHAVPLLHRPGRRHEAQPAAEQRRVLQAEVDLDAPRRLSGRRRVGDRHEDAAQASVLRLDDARTHLRRDRGAGGGDGDRRRRPRDAAEENDDEARQRRRQNRPQRPSEAAAVGNAGGGRSDDERHRHSETADQKFSDSGRLAGRAASVD